MPVKVKIFAWLSLTQKDGLIANFLSPKLRFRKQQVRCGIECKGTRLVWVKFYEIWMEVQYFLLVVLNPILNAIVNWMCHINGNTKR